ncbi:unnamed protein product, partial [Sphacelaria rigidula]
SGSVGGIDWLAQAVHPSATARPTAAGSTNGADWLTQAAVGRNPNRKLKTPGAATAPPRTRPKTKSEPALSWMSKMKRRSSMDLEDEAVEAAAVQAKVAAAAAVPGNWLKMGTLGAPDAVEADRELQ